MCALVTKIDKLNAFIFGTNHFREGPPSRWELIAEFVKSQTNNPGEDIPTVCIGKRESVTKKYVDLKKKEDSRMMSTFLAKNYPFLLSNEFNVSRLNVSEERQTKQLFSYPLC